MLNMKVLAVFTHLAFSVWFHHQWFGHCNSAVPRGLINLCARQWHACIIVFWNIPYLPEFKSKTSFLCKYPDCILYSLMFNPVRYFIRRYQ
jgi:hypothetical protein